MHPAPAIDARIFWQPKSGHRAEEYEDAAFVSQGGGLPLNASVTDGATETAYSRHWAKHLVQGFAAEGGATSYEFAAALPHWQLAWQEEVGSDAGSPWYAQAKRREGAFAAFLGLRILEEGRWRAISIGDCCLFHLRGGFVSSWPFDTPAAFTSRPALVPSLPGEVAPQPHVTEGNYQSGDVFVLATDALAAWLMDDSLVALLPSWTPTDFETAVQVSRADGSLRDDDVTALLLEIE